MKQIRKTLAMLSCIVMFFGILPGRSTLAGAKARGDVEVDHAVKPAGLNVADWAQIKAQLPALASINSQQAYLKASNTDANDYFGVSIAVSGDTVVVGAYQESSNATGVNGNQVDNSAAYSGAVYVFVRSGATWSQQAYLKASNTGASDYFGKSVAISGDTVVVGADGEDSIAIGVNGNQSDDSAANSGAAYVFVRNGTTWSQQAYLKASNTEGGDWFGFSVSISGNTVVVGAPTEDSNAIGVNGDQANNSAYMAGATYVFTRSGTTWSQQAYLKASNTGAQDEFGYSVAISGDTAVVGAIAEDSNATGVNGSQADNSAVDSGAAYAFTRNGMDWSQQAYLKASNTGAGDGFGFVAVFEDTAVVGAPFEDSSATGVNGNQADNGATYAGAAYVFTRSGADWSQQAYLKASNTGGNDWFGGSVAISGDTVAGGAQSEDSNATGVNGNQTDNSAADSGAAYVFTRSGATWSQQTYLKASNTGAGDEFGYAAAVSGDTVVMGAYAEDSNAAGVNGDQADNSASYAGAAYVFVPSGLNSAPTDITLSNSRVAENQAVGTLVGTLSTTDPDAGDTFTYSFPCATPGVDDSKFAISGGNLNTAAAFDYETKNSYAICVRSTDAGSLSLDKNFTVSVTDVNEEVARNGGFNTYPVRKKIPTFWAAVNFAPTDGKDTRVKKEGIASVKIIGVLGKKKTLTQTISLNGTAGDTFTLSFWAKASLLPSSGLCQAQVLFYSGATLKGVKTLKCPTGKTYNWKAAKLNFTAPGPYTKIVIKLTYSKASGTVWFDGVSLLR